MDARTEALRAWCELAGYCDDRAERWSEPSPHIEAFFGGYDAQAERIAVLEKRLRHSEFHRTSNRRSMRQRGKTIIRLSAKIARQRATIRDLQGGGKKRNALELAAELHHTLRTEDQA